MASLPSGTLRNPAPREATYIFSDSVAWYLYWPVNKLDRRARRLTWNEYGVADEFARKWVDLEMDVLASTDPKIDAKFLEAQRLISDSELLVPKTPHHKNKVKEALQALDDLKVLLNQATP